MAPRKGRIDGVRQSMDFFGEAWDELKRVSQEDTRLRRWVSPGILTLWVYNSILEHRQGARDARIAALAEFDERFGERLHQWLTESLEANLEARAAGEFDPEDPGWVERSLEDDLPFFLHLLEDARPVIGPFISTWVYGADHLSELVILDFICIFSNRLAKLSVWATTSICKCTCSICLAHVAINSLGILDR